MATGAVARATRPSAPGGWPSAVSPCGRHYAATWAVEGLILLWLLLAVLVLRESIRMFCPAARLIRPLTLASLPLIVLLVSVIVLRFAALS